METANIATYLDPYGYKAAGPTDWRLAPGKSPGAPTLKLAVNGHGERSSHTFYAVSCQLTAEAPASLSLEWLAQRRLAQLREELHDMVKNELGDGYGPFFSKAPFAKRGGPSGTTERLQKWLETLASCVNEGVAPPALVAQVLRFLEVPHREPAEAQEDPLPVDEGGAVDTPVYMAETPTSVASRRSYVGFGAEAARREESASPDAAPVAEEALPAKRDSSASVGSGAPRRSPRAGAGARGASSRPELQLDLGDASAEEEPGRRSTAMLCADSSGEEERVAAASSSTAPVFAGVGDGEPSFASAAAAPAVAPAVRGPPTPTYPRPAPLLTPSSTAGEEDEPPVGSDMVSLYLAPFGYLVASPEEWQQAPKRSFGTPTLALSVNGHEERGSHTYYDVHCWFVAKKPSLHLEWLAQRRLVGLREELHDVVKNELGGRYAELFAKAPFAKRGGFSGTTLRLQRWLEVLAASVNDGVAPPALVAQVLLFLGAPAQTEHHAAAGSTDDDGQGEPARRMSGSGAGRDRSRSVESSGSTARRRTLRPDVPDAFLPGSESSAGHAASVASVQSRPRREVVDRGCCSCDDAADATTDDEGPPVWSPEKRRAGYEKLREWFRELRRRLESRVKRQTSQSPRQRNIEPFAS